MEFSGFWRFFFSFLFLQTREAVSKGLVLGVSEVYFSTGSESVHGGEARAGTHTEDK